MYMVNFLKFIYEHLEVVQREKKYTVLINILWDLALLIDDMKYSILRGEQIAEMIRDSSRMDPWNIVMPPDLHFLPEKTKLYQKVLTKSNAVCSLHVQELVVFKEACVFEINKIELPS